MFQAQEHIKLVLRKMPYRVSFFRPLAQHFLQSLTVPFKDSRYVSVTQSEDCNSLGGGDNLMSGRAAKRVVSTILESAWGELVPDSNMTVPSIYDGRAAGASKGAAGLSFLLAQSSPLTAPRHRYLPPARLTALAVDGVIHPPLWNQEQVRRQHRQPLLMKHTSWRLEQVHAATRMGL